MTPRRALAIGIVLATIGLGLWLRPREAVTPEQQVRAMIEGCIAGIEEGDIAPTVEAMSMRFKGPSGMSRDEVRGVLLGQVMRNPERITILNPSLDLQQAGPGLMSFSGDFVLSRKQDGTTRYRISGTVALEDDAWRFTEVSWQQP